ncbi:MAG: c-type cytochrome [Rhodopila sp.]
MLWSIPNRLWPWLAAVAAAFVLIVRSTPARLDGPVPVVRRPPSPRPLLLAGVAIVLATVGWLAFRVWEAGSEADEVARALTGGDPEQAPALAVRYGCAGCHTMPGIPGADGKVGPSLAGLRERVFIAGVLPNTADNLVAWIEQPRQFSPRTAMPTTGITTSEARDIAAWLYGR